MDDLLAEFVAETRETMEALAGAIVAWEADPRDASRLDEIFRFVHTVKGSCGFLDLPRLERLSHAAEDALAEVRGGGRVPDTALVNAVLGVIDRIAELTDAIALGEPLPDGDDALLIGALAAREPTPGTEAAALPRVGMAARAPARSIRLPVELLDRMMAGVSDMVLARNELGRKLGESGGGAEAEAAFERLSQSIGEMRDAITRTRMARIDNLFSALPRMVRDLSAELGKPVTLDIDGGDVELDREMIEMIRDPLTHIVRNAIDHGIEPVEERLHAGKPAAGRLCVSARQAGNQILIDVVDDGRGIDAERLVAKAVAAGLIDERQAKEMSWARKLELVFTPGLSTARAVTAISGRGVGMDVVRANVERIGGTVEIESRLGQGLSIGLRVPLTLTIIPALTVSAGGHRFAIPRAAIEELVRTGGQALTIETVGGAEIASLRGRRLPVVDLPRLLRLDPARREERPVLVVLRTGGGDRYALRVEAVHDHEELVVKPAAPAVMAAGIYAGTTLPDNSRPMLLLDVSGVAQRAGIAHVTAAAEPEPVVERLDHVVQRLVFRDLDGATRAVRLALVERIEDVPAERIADTAGRCRLWHDGRLLPLMSCGAPLPDTVVRILRMSDGVQQIAYAVDRLQDIVETSDAPVPAATPGLVGGVAVIAGEQVELIDPYWLFGEAGTTETPVARPLCLMADGDDPWLRQVLAPLVATAGYRVVYPGQTDEPAALVIATERTAGDALPAAPVLRLRSARDGGDDSIYRYDRAGVLDALRQRAGGGR